MKNRLFSLQSVALSALIVLTLIGTRFAQAQTTDPTILASFSGTNGINPGAGLTLSNDGLTFYGSTYRGGPSGNSGTVFSIPVGGGVITTLASFNSTNGGSPVGDLILNGNTLYGTTMAGGAGGYGTVFSVPTSGGAPTTLGTFRNGITGLFPTGGLTLGGSTLYGTTQQGGTRNAGTVFSVPLAGGTIKNIVNFGDTNGDNGASPRGGVILLNGKLYGTSYGGGGNSTVFSVPLAGGTPTTLGSFGASSSGPTGMLTLIGSTLYGTTSMGGASSSSAGTVFSMPLEGGAITTLASFDGTNGGGPAGRLTLVGTTLYGTTEYGGPGNEGTLFSIPLGGGAITTLIAFNGTNGSGASSNLTLIGNTLYGTTSRGGAFDDGTVFSVNVPEPPAWATVLGGSGLLALGMNRRVRRAQA